MFKLMGITHKRKKETLSKECQILSIWPVEILNIYYSIEFL